MLLHSDAGKLNFLKGQPLHTTPGSTALTVSSDFPQGWNSKKKQLRGVFAHVNVLMHRFHLCFPVCWHKYSYCQEELIIIRATTFTLFLNTSGYYHCGMILILSDHHHECAGEFHQEGSEQGEAPQKMIAPWNIYSSLLAWTTHRASLYFLV